MKSTFESPADPAAAPPDRALAAHQKLWSRLGADDPIWAILTEPAKRRNQWEENDFFQTGVAEIAALKNDLAKRHAFEVAGRALDFGCGVGRLTQALAQHFDEVVGVDISPSMIAHARSLNRNGAKCRFYVNARPDLEIFPAGSFDFVYSNIVLQHIPPAISLAYIREFVRVLRPGGVAVFQLPDRPALTLTGVLLRMTPIRLVRLVRKMDMYGVAAATVLKTISGAGAVLLECRPDSAAGPHWIGYRYALRKP
jgi:SAM-dependent methyltransferase